MRGRTIQNSFKPSTATSSQAQFGTAVGRTREAASLVVAVVKRASTVVRKALCS